VSTPRDLLVGIDAGTSMVKAVAFDRHGRQVAVTALPNAYADVGGGGVEQDMARTWDDTARVLRSLAEQVDDLAARTAALAVTAQGDGTWLVDEAGEPVAPAGSGSTAAPPPSSSGCAATARGPGPTRSPAPASTPASKGCTSSG
jgi:sugar (pentulose or hexulose) kinase